MEAFASHETRSRTHTMDRFFADAAKGTLPALTWIDPRQGINKTLGNLGGPNSDHPSCCDVALGERLREAIHLAQIDNGQVVFVDKRQASSRFATLARTGQVAPAYCTGVGKAILAHLEPEAQAQALQQQAFLKYTDATHTSTETLVRELEQIRAEGIAFDREEHEAGIISIAAPILTDAGRVVGAVSIATATHRHTLDGLNAFRPALLDCATRIGAEAQSWQSPSVPS